MAHGGDGYPWCWDTYSKEHALDLFDGAQAAKEGHQCDKGASGYQDVHGAHEQVCAQQLIDERFIH